MVAANRANSLKSTGPRTARDKGRVALNSLKHCRYAVRLPEKLLQTGDPQGEAQYRWFRREIAATFVMGGRRDQRQAEADGGKAWCVARDMTAPGEQSRNLL